MIPVRLEFAAFGPFPQKQIIDFTRFDDDRLFFDYRTDWKRKDLPSLMR